MGISKEEVEHVVGLARLDLTPEEVGKYAEQLSSILGYFEKLKEVDTSQVKPTFHAINLTNRFREDKTRPSLPLDQALANAPARRETTVLVPRVIEVD